MFSEENNLTTEKIKFYSLTSVALALCEDILSHDNQL